MGIKYRLEQKSTTSLYLMISNHSKTSKLIQVKASTKTIKLFLLKSNKTIEIPLDENKVKNISDISVEEL